MGRPFSAWILVRRLCQTLKLCREAIWQVSEDPYHTEFVSWCIDHFSFPAMSKQHKEIPRSFFVALPKRQNNVASSYFLLLCQSDKIMLQGAIFCRFVKATKKCFFELAVVAILVKETRKLFFDGGGPFFQGHKEIARNLRVWWLQTQSLDTNIL